ncbi:hypothetical protein ACWPKO_25340 (plasmid) [Coraliomargarita sp. W4R53]
MTLRDLLLAMGRRWYVIAVVFAGVALFGASVWSDVGVFSTRTVVSFTFPYETTLTPDNATSNESVIAFAGLVAAEISPRTPTVKYSSADAPYYGAGLREGVLVGLQDDGSQWAPSYGSAVLEIQIVGPDEQWVADRQQALLARVDESARAQQDLMSISDKDRITARVEPLTTKIEHILPSRTAQIAALGALFLAGLLVGTWGAVTLDHGVSRRREHSRSKGRIS